jgi:hypothetical protein
MDSTALRGALYSGVPKVFGRTVHANIRIQCRLNIPPFFLASTPILTSTAMPRRGKELPPHLRTRICELRSLGWSYDKIYTKHPDVPRSTIAYTCVKEAEQVNNNSKPRVRAPRIVSEDERDSIVEAVILTPAMTYKALQAQEAPNASIRSIKQLFQEMNMQKWIRLRRPALTEQHI